MLRWHCWYNKVIPVNQLAILNEHLAKQSSNRKRTIKIILISIAAMVLLTFIIYIALFSLYSFEKTSESTTITELQYTIDGEEYINDN